MMRKLNANELRKVEAGGKKLAKAGAVVCYAGVGSMIAFGAPVAVGIAGLAGGAVSLWNMFLG